MPTSSLVETTVAPGAGACCPPLVRAPLAAEVAERVARTLKAIADPVRLRLLSLIASHADGEACVCDLNDAFDLSQPTISHHLRLLHEAGLVSRDKRGVWAYYRVETAVLDDLGRLLSSDGLSGERLSSDRT